MDYGHRKFTVITNNIPQEYTLNIRFSEDEGNLSLYIIYSDLADLLDTLRIRNLKEINFEIKVKMTTNLGNQREVKIELPEEIMNMTSAELRII